MVAGARAVNALSAVREVGVVLEGMPAPDRAAVLAHHVAVAARHAPDAELALALILEMARERLAAMGQVVLVLCALAASAQAAPPVVGSEDWEILHPHAAWINGLEAGGMRCCDWSDTRPVEARAGGAGWQVRFRAGQIAGAPHGVWMDVPEAAVLRLANPVGMPIASFWGGQVRCFVPPGGI
jgi:hypothetical protein